MHTLSLSETASLSWKRVAGGLTTACYSQHDYQRKLELIYYKVYLYTQMLSTFYMQSSVDMTDIMTDTECE